jgi:hypothetical protein
VDFSDSSSLCYRCLHLSKLETLPGGMASYAKQFFVV